jgi:hypothetical protein
MKRPGGSRRLPILVAAAVLVVLVASIAVLAAGGGEARGSSLSRGPGGWLAARRYLEARGARVRLLDRPPEQLEGRGVLVATFPWQHGLSFAGGADEPLDAHLRHGGALVLAYSGDLASPAEIVALKALGLSLREVRKATLNPLRWRRFTREEWDLRPAPGVTGAGPVRIWAPRGAPEMPAEARAIYQGPRREVMVAVLPRYRGTIWLVPADAFANARLGNPGNAALLETLRQRLGDDWAFDEYHHGLAGRVPVETEALGRTLDLVLLHLAVLYLAALLALARPFGPAWRETPVVTGSAGAFLLGLGVLHHRLGHHRQAAERLLARVRELDRNLALPADLDRRAGSADARGLVALAREVARRRRGGAAVPEPENEQEIDAP